MNVRCLVPSTLLVLTVLSAALLAAPHAAAGDNVLKDLMKKLGAATATGEAKPLAPFFEQTRGMAPKDPDFASWAAISERGKAAAEKGDLTGVKATCRECHDAHRTTYRTRYGSKAP